jgi:hypothetical protein
VCYHVVMRLVVLASIAASSVLLGGCPMGNGGGGECTVDRECIRSEVCARDGSCMAASALRDVKATWTLSGMTASETTCAGHTDLYISFEGGPGESIGFSPVPCANGQFLITKLPKTYTRVELGVHNGASESAVVDSSNQATLDLPL